MKLFAPASAPALDLVDIYGQAIPIGGTGRRTLLSFFRDAACPFCNFRIYELTHHHASLSALGLDIVAVFGSGQAEVLHFVARHPRPFRVAADPVGASHLRYGIERSFWRKLKAARMPFGGVVVNRVHHDFLGDEDVDVVADSLSGELGDKLAARVADNFRDYHVLARRDADNVERLRTKLRDDRRLLVPALDEDVHDVAGLERINRYLVATEAERERLMADVVA